MQGLGLKVAVASIITHQVYHTAKAIDTTRQNHDKIAAAAHHIQTDPDQKILGYHGGKSPVAPTGRHGHFYTTSLPTTALLYAQREAVGAVGIVSIPRSVVLKTTDVTPSLSETPDFNPPKIGDADYCISGFGSGFIPAQKIATLPLNVVSVPVTPIDSQALLYKGLERIVTPFIV